MVTNKEKNFITAVIYIHNGEGCIKGFLNNVNQILYNNFDNYEIICVNDDSTDKSVSEIKDFSNEIQKSSVISVVNLSYYHGVELAMNAGIDLAIGDFVFEFDSLIMDYDLETIMKVYNHSLRGFDIVSSAPRTIKHKSSRFFYFIFNNFSGNHYNLRTESFRILSRRAINRVHSMSKTIPYRKANYATCGLKIDCLVYEVIDNIKIKKTKKIIQKRKNMAMDSLVLFTDIASKFSIAMTILMMLVAVLTAGYTVFIFISQRPVAGWTTTMLFLSVAFFAVFVLLAIIIKYLSIIMSLTFNKQRYIIESIEKISKS